MLTALQRHSTISMDTHCSTHTLAALQTLTALYRYSPISTDTRCSPKTLPALYRHSLLSAYTCCTPKTLTTLYRHSLLSTDIHCSPKTLTDLYIYSLLFTDTHCSLQTHFALHRHSSISTDTHCSLQILTALQRLTKFLQTLTALHIHLLLSSLYIYIQRSLQKRLLSISITALNRYFTALHRHSLLSTDTQCTLRTPQLSTKTLLVSTDTHLQFAEFVYPATPVRTVDAVDAVVENFSLRVWVRKYLQQAQHTASQLVSLNRLSVGCGTTPRRQSGTIYGFCLVSA